MTRICNNREEKYEKELLGKEYRTHSKRVRVSVQMNWRTQRHHTKEKQDLGKEVKDSKI